MASFAVACRMSARLAARKVQQDAATRGFRTSAAALAAQNFTMPALSPTMTEGNIAAWRVKEGDKFSAGDVLLEIETDKATMDVEAQEDGILMKVMQADGSKGVQVGTRIAVIAEEGDDIASLQIPAEENSPAAQSAQTPSPQSPPGELQSAAPSAPAAAPTPAPGAKTFKQTYPLYPSVAQLIKQHGIDKAAVSSITPTGPGGRLLKGDVLAFLGKINAATPSTISARFNKASHLDLSNIKVAAQKPAPKQAKPAPPPPPPAPAKSLVSLPVSLVAVIEAQAKIQKTLGIFLPLSTFVARAADVANDALPLPAGYQPTADELFNQVLGLDKVGAAPAGSRGAYVPQIAALPPAGAVVVGPKKAAKKVDILDVLAAAPRKPAAVKKTAVVPGASAAGPNLFSLRVPKAEERRAQVFLERVKVVLENEPGRLVL
ncbi:pyruvate dehydrogenase complex protein X component, mitochondrial [Staphylotrichum tortipilum]|uniref:Pyruvate dehydrogenase complex protein X component, mitochondrial n=1 Tax=Staphylotrichum tortipilum TaxID=2831512 RepID=A0AAN6RS00_9PEZI|nr:pyruvate dehydrogenase complex protein X component, mitochondrial [Staphylotrichum longicolle]